MRDTYTCYRAPKKTSTPLSPPGTRSQIYVKLSNKEESQTPAPKSDSSTARRAGRDGFVLQSKGPIFSAKWWYNLHADLSKREERGAMIKNYLSRTPTNKLHPNTEPNALLYTTMVTEYLDHFYGPPRSIRKVLIQSADSCAIFCCLNCINYLIQNVEGIVPIHVSKDTKTVIDLFSFSFKDQPLLTYGMNILDSDRYRYAMDVLPPTASEAPERTYSNIFEEGMAGCILIAMLKDVPFYMYKPDKLLLTTPNEKPDDDFVTRLGVFTYFHTQTVPKALRNMKRSKNPFDENCSGFIYDLDEFKSIPTLQSDNLPENACGILRFKRSNNTAHWIMWYKTSTAHIRDSSILRRENINDIEWGFDKYFKDIEQNVKMTHIVVLPLYKLRSDDLSMLSSQFSNVAV